MFHKGYQPWNKGKKVVFSDDWRRSIGLSRIGMRFSNEHRDSMKKAWVGRRKKGKGTPWNKGLVGFMCGDEHYNWQNGKTSKARLIRNGLELKIWRRCVFQRDAYTCKKCGSKSGVEFDGTVVLHAHHIFHFKLLCGTVLQHHICDIDNGVTLCRPCHRQIHNLNSYKEQS